MSKELYCQVIDCPGQGRVCSFVNKVDTGEFHSHGKGTMNYRVCKKCHKVEYDKFTDENGEVTWTRPNLKKIDKNFFGDFLGKN